MIPRELTDLNQWMTWSIRDGAKVPAGKSNDPATWKPFAVVKDLDRKAFVFSENDPYCGVDLDDCIDDGHLTDWAYEIVEKLQGVSYAEISPSGKGVKLITRAKKPSGSRCSNGKGVECYDHSRFWTITGNVLGVHNEIGDGQEAIDWLCAKHLTQEKPKPQKLATMPVMPTTGIHQRAQAYVEALSPGVVGDLRNAAFRNSGHLHAIVGDMGERLTTDEVYGYLCQWNTRNPQALKDNELREAAKNGAKNGTPPPDKLPEVAIVDDYSDIDLSALLGEDRTSDDDIDDDDFAFSMVPQSGLMAEIYDYYIKSAYRSCPVFALATSIAFCQSLFGRKVASETNLRTNDYHLILAPTTSGKEGPLTVVNNLMVAGGCADMVLPEKIQSGNGLLGAIKDNPSSIWVCDEFGYVLASILDKKSKDANAKAIAQMLLSLYGKSGSVFTGSAYAGRKDHAIHQPHVCVLGVSTGHTVFKEISESQVLDGMLGRISFWSVQERPKPNRAIDMSIPEKLSESIKAWHQWTPESGGNLGGFIPSPLVVRFTDAARERWRAHEDAIDSHMNHERAIRSSLWGRTAARSMKLALTHRVARLQGPAEVNEFSKIEIELSDIEWGISIANFCTRLACSLVTETVADTAGEILKRKVAYVIEHAGKPVTKRDVQRAIKTADAGQIAAIVNELAASGIVKCWVVTTKGRPRHVVEWVVQ